MPEGADPGFSALWGLMPRPFRGAAASPPRARSTVVGRRFIFGRMDRALFRQAPQADPSELWSPPAVATGETGASRHRSIITEQKPLEAKVPGLFRAIDAAAAPSPSPRKPKPPPPEVCVICLEDIDRMPLKCPQCTMSAHPQCLAKWFGSDSSHSGTTTALPKSSASCPSCREKLDCAPTKPARARGTLPPPLPACSHLPSPTTGAPPATSAGDALALQARRRRAAKGLPLGASLERGLKLHVGKYLVAGDENAPPY